MYTNKKKRRTSCSYLGDVFGVHAALVSLGKTPSPSIAIVCVADLIISIKDDEASN